MKKVILLPFRVIWLLAQTQVATPCDGGFRARLLSILAVFGGCNAHQGSSPQSKN